MQRYANDITETWKGIRLKIKKRIVPIAVLAGVVTFPVFQAIEVQLCYTSMVGEDWVLGQCPVPPLNITELLVAGAKVNL